MEQPSGAPTRPSLLLRLRDPQDAAAWGTFVEVYGPLVFGHCRRRGLQHPDAEDVTQKVFVVVAGAIRSFDYRPDVGLFRHWLGTVVRNEVSHFFRKRARETQGPDGAGEEALDEAEARVEDTAWNEEFNAHVLRVALDRSRPHFEADTWRAFERVWLENRPAAQTAEEMGRPIDWVYVAKSRVLKHLWEEVRELAEDAPLLTSRAPPQ
jgi:RNA polymerase sigma factor (sigma-70 family)